MTNTKQTLVILSPGFPENENDTTCLPAQQVFVRALNKNFPLLEVIIISFDYPYFSASYKWNGNTVISIYRGSKGKLNRIITWLKAWRILNKIKKENTITGLLSFWITECALIGKYFGRLHNIKHYGWILGQDARKNNVYVPLIRPQVDEIIALSDFLANQFYENYHIRPEIVIPNGIDVNLFSKESLERNIDILAAGSLIPLKQYDVFIEAVKLINSKIPGVKAMLCGKGPEEKRLQSLISVLNMEKNIQLTGEKKHTEVLHLMQQSKVFLHTSNYEGFSTVCLEALYAGAHVISFFRPMDKDIDRWHIVATKEEMAKKAVELLSGRDTEYIPALVYSMDDIAKAVVNLFEA